MDLQTHLMIGRRDGFGQTATYLPNVNLADAGDYPQVEEGTKALLERGTVGEPKLNYEEQSTYDYST